MPSYIMEPTTAVSSSDEPAVGVLIYRNTVGAGQLSSRRHYVNRQSQMAETEPYQAGHSQHLH